ncbi:MAG: GNAT family N-acetyltransferase, partial [Clostridiales bacterium]|nr:GNAT family N-acetyltransferase [Clostridiales bacterium]
MIYELKDLSKVEHLFGDWMLPELKDWDGPTIRIFVTDPDAPRSAMLFHDDEGEFFAGEPDRELVQSKQAKSVALMAKEKAWEPLFRECYPEAERVTRYAIRRCRDFDREKLQSFVDALPEGYEIRRIDSEIYDLCEKVEDEDLDWLTGDFETKEEFLAKGRGFVVMKDGKIAAGASSAYCYCDGIEVEIDTHRAERRKGLATAVGAKLILSCLDDGLEPRWDAANLISVHLADKLGYRFDREYAYYWV